MFSIENFTKTNSVLQDLFNEIDKRYAVQTKIPEEITKWKFNVINLFFSLLNF